MGGVYESVSPGLGSNGREAEFFGVSFLEEEEEEEERDFLKGRVKTTWASRTPTPCRWIFIVNELKAESSELVGRGAALWLSGGDAEPLSCGLAECGRAWSYRVQKR